MEEVKEGRPFSEIPSALLWDILGRVSIKTCLTCKLVCKEWYHIIVAPEFSSFRRRCVASHFDILFCDVNDGWWVSFNLFELDKALDVDDLGNYMLGVDDVIKFTPKSNVDGIFSVVSHCNEVVCVPNTREDYFVCKLLTGECVKVQNLHQLRNQSFVILGCDLGWSLVSDQFKVLIPVLDKVKYIRLVKVQTLGDGEWRSVGNAPSETWRGGCFLNGSSHMLGRGFIWCFHFEEEEFSRIPFPDDVNNARGLSVFKSCLCLSSFSYGVSLDIDIWTMEEYGVKETWVKQFVMMNDALYVPLVHALHLPLVLMDKGKILLKYGLELYLYDLQTRVSKRVKFSLNGHSLTMFSNEAFDVFRLWHLM